MNPYGVNHTPLKRARLPVPPLSHYAGLLPDCLDIISDFARLVNPFFNLFILFEKEFLPSCRETRYSIKRCAAAGVSETVRHQNSAGESVIHGIHREKSLSVRRKTNKTNHRRREKSFESERGKSRRRSVKCCTRSSAPSARFSLYSPLSHKLPSLSAIFLPLYVRIKSAFSAAAFSSRPSSLSRMRNTARLHSAHFPIFSRHF